ncbi:MAG: hypothetical protein QM749_03210 [Aquabacterium sp.]
MKQVILIRPDAPRKPPLGATCNGCGVCCLAEPCPVGVLVSRRLKGACKALVWSDEAGRYHCGLLMAVSVDGPIAAQGRLRRVFRPLWQRWVRRMISAGSGCDASIEVESAPCPEK